MAKVQNVLNVDEGGLTNVIVPLITKEKKAAQQRAPEQDERQYWETELTIEFRALITILEKAKEQSGCFTFIAETGRGKTYTIEVFMQRHHRHTYCVTINSLCAIKDITDELCRMLSIPISGTERYKLYSIIQKLREIKRHGGKPLIIFDECENMKLSTLGMLKGLYDGISKYCGIAVVGTPQFLELIDTLRNRNKQGVPQLFRRLKAGMTIMRNNRDSVKSLVDKFVNDQGLRMLLYELCENYGEVHDYVEPALREADKRGVALTEDFFRIMYDMPKYTEDITNSKK